MLSNGDLIFSYTKNLSAEGKLVGADLRVFHSARLLLSAFVAERQPLEQLGDALQNLLQPLLLLEGRAILGRRSDRKLERLQVGKNFLDPETQQTTKILVWSAVASSPTKPNQEPISSSKTSEQK